MKNVLYILHPWRFWRERLAGVYRFAERAGWHVHVEEYGRTMRSVSRMLGFWHPDGCIVEGGITEYGRFRQRDFGSLPVVYCDANPERVRGRALRVEHDSDASALLAIRELMKFDLSDYAFVGNLQPRIWSDRRGDLVSRVVSDAGLRFHSFASLRNSDYDTYRGRLRMFLRDLPKPCGVLAANDITADIVLRTCGQELIRVPEELSVIGIDNDELICEHTVPTLTSVQPDFELSGYLAADLLSRRFADPALATRTVVFGSRHVVRRGSTTRFVRRDEGVRAAVELIRKAACQGLTSAAVCAAVGGSRRQAEKRFKGLMGHSVGEEITAVRIAKAKELLLRRDQAIDGIYAQCGYRDASSLRRAFKKETGFSLAAWRKTDGGATS